MQTLGSISFNMQTVGVDPDHIGKAISSVIADVSGSLGIDPSRVINVALIQEGGLLTGIEPTVLFEEGMRLRLTMGASSKG